MALRLPVPLEPADAVGGVHFVAIGGAGMSGIASAYSALGVAVSGCDRADSATLRQLAAEGIRTHIGHDTDHLAAADTLVVSSAIPADNVEVAAARERGLRVWHRSAALGALMIGRRGVSITGTHGKTTTTGLTATLLLGAGADPGYVIGSPLAATGRSAALGTGEAFVVEADESDGSFLQYPAEIVVITNVEADHLDNWGNADAYRAGFLAVATQPRVRVVIACADDPGALAVADQVRAAGVRVVTYGEHPSADVLVAMPEETAEVTRATVVTEDDAGEIELAVPGHVNLLNAAAAYAVGRELGLSGPALRAAASSFTGTLRRFEHKGSVGGVRVFDDYAHHPTEVTATLRAARSRVGEGRLVVLFQPHLFSRTAEFAAEFGTALAAADVVVVAGVYPARERAEDFPGVTGALVADAVAARGRAVTYVPDIADAPAALAEVVRPGDLVLTMGAGDVTDVGVPLVGLLAGRA